MILGACLECGWIDWADTIPRGYPHTQSVGRRHLLGKGQQGHCHSGWALGPCCEFHPQLLPRDEIHFNSPNPTQPRSYPSHPNQTAHRSPSVRSTAPSSSTPPSSPPPPRSTPPPKRTASPATPSRCAGSCTTRPSTPGRGTGSSSAPARSPNSRRTWQSVARGRCRGRWCRRWRRSGSGSGRPGVCQRWRFRIKGVE